MGIAMGRQRGGGRKPRCGEKGPRKRVTAGRWRTGAEAEACGGPRPPCGPRRRSWWDGARRVGVGGQGWSGLKEGRRGRRRPPRSPDRGEGSSWRGTGSKPPAHLFTATPGAQHGAWGQGLGCRTPLDRTEGELAAASGGSWATACGSPLSGASFFSGKEEAGRTPRGES